MVSAVCIQNMTTISAGCLRNMTSMSPVCLQNMKKHHQLFVYNLQMAQFMCSHNDARKSSSIFNNGHGIDFFKPLIYDTSATYIGKSRGTSITFTKSVGPSAHVQPKKPRIHCANSNVAIHNSQIRNLRI